MEEYVRDYSILLLLLLLCFPIKNEIGIRVKKLHCLKVIFQKIQEGHSNMGHYSQVLELVLEIVLIKHK